MIGVKSVVKEMEVKVGIPRKSVEYRTTPCSTHCFGPCFKADPIIASCCTEQFSSLIALSQFVTRFRGLRPLVGPAPSLRLALGGC